MLAKLTDPYTYPCTYTRFTRWLMLGRQRYRSTNTTRATDRDLESSAAITNV
jgi:hypothetical protein